MPDDKKTPSKKEKAQATPPQPKDRFTRNMVSYLTSDKMQYYARGERVYVDTANMKGPGLMPLEGEEFRSFLLREAKQMENILMRSADASLIVDHVRFFAMENATELSQDNRAYAMGDEIFINTGWKHRKLLVIKPDSQNWEERIVEERIFEPIPPEMSVVVPKIQPAMQFPELLKKGIADFGDYHCLIAVSCATMMLPSTFSHPFLVFTGQQARGKSTTMKLLLQLIDPYAGGELMTVGDDSRDLIALCRDRHCIAMDNVSYLPFDEDLLSKMYSGGMFAARKMTTNSELSKAMMPRLRVMMNGIGTAFSRSDLMSRCIFIEHPALTKKDEHGHDMFEPIESVEAHWQKSLPKCYGALLSAVAEGWHLFEKQGGLKGKSSRSRYVEYCIIGECMSQVMGFEPGLFTEQVNEAAEIAEQTAIETDDCAQLILAYLNGERGEGHQLEAEWGGTPTAPVQEKYVISSTDLYKEIKKLSASRSYTTYGIKWLTSVKSFSTAINRSQKNIENGGWRASQVKGGVDKRKWEFCKIFK